MSRPKLVASIFLPFFLFFTAYLQPADTTVILPVVHGRFIDEFYSYLNNNSNLIVQAGQWITYSPMSAYRTSTCGSWFILGGLGVLNNGGYFQRTYSNLPSHTTIYYMIHLLIIDQWSSMDTLTIKFDNDSPLIFNPSTAQASKGTALCGNSSYNDVHYRIVGKAVHSGSSMRLQVISGVSGSVGAFGINRIKIAFRNETTPTSSTCATFDGGSAKGTTCPCEQGQYESPALSGNCIDCDPSCDHCFDSGSTGCFVCAEGYNWDGTRCVQGCSSGCQICSPDNGRCSVCLPTHALAWDYTCRMECIAPLYIESAGTYKFCKTPCQDSGKFMLWNGTCSDACGFPLSSRVEQRAKFCDYPCNAALNEYLYINGTCSTHCEFIRRLEGSLRFCDPCPSTSDYFNWDGSCVSNCSAPMRSRVEGDYKACEHLCQDNSSYYYPQDGLCRPICTYPYKTKDNWFCVIDLAGGQLDTLDLIGQSLAESASFFGAAGVVAAAINYGNAGPLFLYALSEVLKFIRYIDVAFPPKLQYIFEEQKPSGDLLPFIPSIPNEFASKFEKRPLPEKFGYYELHSSFLVNSWKPLVCVTATFSLILLVAIITLCTRSGSCLYAALHKIKEALQWNFFFGLSGTFYTNIILTTSLELRTLHFGSIYNVLSFTMCIISNAILLVVAIRTIIVLSILWTSRLRRPTSEAHQDEYHLLREKYENYKIILKDYKVDSLVQFAFLPLLILRLCLFGLVIACLFDYPLIQSILIVLISGIMVIYLLLKNPFRHLVEFIEFLLQEVLILIVNICVLIFAVLDQFKIEAYNERETIGTVVIIASLVSAGVAAIYFIFHLFKALRVIYRFLIAHCKSQKPSLAAPNKPNVTAEVHSISKDITRGDISIVGNDSMNNLELSSNVGRGRPPRDSNWKNGVPSLYVDQQSVHTLNRLDETAEPIGNQSKQSIFDQDMLWDNKESYLRRRNSTRRKVAPVIYSPRSKFEEVNSMNSLNAGNEPSSMNNIHIEQQQQMKPGKPQSISDVDWKPNQMKRK